MVSAFGVSHPGTVRQTNEDTFLVQMELSLFLVADGMGGHAAGEIASRLAVESIGTFVERSHDTEDFSWPCGIDRALSFDGNRLRTSLYLANRRIFRLAEEHDEYVGMGSTVVGALIRQNRLIIGHVGDSGLYLWSAGILTPQTRDDTWAATLLAGSAEGDAAIASHPRKHVLTNVLGARGQAELHVSERELCDGDMLLLGSDGIHNVLDDRTLAEMMAPDCAVDVIADAMVAEALQRGARDNVTALVVRYSADTAHG